MTETNSEASGNVDNGLEAARKRIQAAAQRAQDRAKQFVGSAATTATKYVGPFQSRFRTAGAEAAANVGQLRERATDAISKARTNAAAVADKVADRMKEQTKTAVETVQANPRVVEALENPRVAAAIGKVTSAAKSVRETVEPYIKRNVS